MILVIGSINMDVSFRVDELPQPGETVLATAMKKSLVGKAQIRLWQHQSWADM